VYDDVALMRPAPSTATARRSTVRCQLTEPALSCASSTLLVDVNRFQRDPMADLPLDTASPTTSPTDVGRGSSLSTMGLSGYGRLMRSPSAHSDTWRVADTGLWSLTLMEGKLVYSVALIPSPSALRKRTRSVYAGSLALGLVSNTLVPTSYLSEQGWK
jgi:hypothetical protein